MSLSEPPDNFDDRTISDCLHHFSSGQEFFRIQDCVYEESLHFGRNSVHRFDDPNREFGVCYVSESMSGAFVETVARKKLEGEAILKEDLKDLCLKRMKICRSLEVLDLRGPNLMKLGVDSSLGSTDDSELTQRWSSAFHSNGVQFDGLRWLARHDNQCKSVAIYDRWEVEDAYEMSGLGPLLPDHEGFVTRMIETYDLNVFSGYSAEES